MIFNGFPLKKRVFQPTYESSAIQNGYVFRIYMYGRSAYHRGSRTTNYRPYNAFMMFESGSTGERNSPLQVCHLDYVYLLDCQRQTLQDKG